MILNGNESNKSFEVKDFSIILAFHNAKLHLKEAILSIINQDIGFNENIQLILIDCGSEDKSFDVAQSFEKNFSDNILLISQKSTNIADGRNLGFKYASGKYINFFDFHDKLDLNALTEVKNEINKSEIEIISLPVINFSSTSKLRNYEQKGLINLEANPEQYLDYAYSSFFKKKLITNIYFDKKVINNFEVKFIAQALLKTKKYVLINDSAFYYFRRRNLMPYEITIKKEFYTSQINYLVELIKISFEKYDKLYTFIKILILKKLVDLIKNKHTSNILNDEELYDFINSIKYILSFYDLEEISDFIEDSSDSAFLIAIKNEDILIENIKSNKASESLKIELDNNTALLKSNNYIIDNLSKRTFILDYVNLREDMLYISGFFKSNFNKSDISVSAIKEYDNNIEVFKAKSFDYKTRSSRVMMGFEWEYIYNFELEIPINSKNEISTVELILNYSNIKLDCDVEFREFCNISYSSHYYVKEDRIVLFNGKFNIMPYSYFKMFKYEITGLLKIFKDKNPFYKQAILFRIINLILYPYMRNKEIWIIMDRKEVADDNAEHFYRYAIKQNDGIKKFFSIFDDSPDFNRIQNSVGGVLPFESLKHRFYYTFASKIISSQGSEFYLNPFKNKSYQLTAGISNVDFYFLQHGIIKDNMSSWLRKYDRNPKLIVTSTQLEYDSMFDEGYNYTEEVIQLLGLPRYDNLTNKGLKKQILITPSWRNYLTNEDEIINSEYFKRFNSLINNEKLIEYASSHDYDIIFKPHPELARYVDLFDKNDYVQFELDKKYPEILNESALMITDYSSIFFDFSYQKKPLIYYQYGNDYHYDAENGYFKYKSMGFGPVIENEDDLVGKIIEYIDNNCKIEEKYTQRIDMFFKYHDHNNCRRCYEWILNH